jgi:hypothetical protein
VTKTDCLNKDLETTQHNFQSIHTGGRSSEIRHAEVDTVEDGIDIKNEKKDDNG